MDVVLLLLVSLFAFSHGQDQTRRMHCSAFRNHFEVYCRGIWTPEKLIRLAHSLDKIEKFCPNYKKHCIKRGSGRKSLSKSGRKRLEKELKYELSYEDILKRTSRQRNNRLAEVTPCTPQCKEPHCTVECKCEYDWPTFQKFCYPKTLKEFDATCSQWFERCPIFARKAEEDGPAEEREIVYHPPLDQARRQIYNRGNNGFINSGYYQ